MEDSDINFCYYSGLPSPLSYTEGKEVKKQLTVFQIDRIIEMAWLDSSPFEAIEYQFGLKENEVKSLMKKRLTYKNYKLWQNRVEVSKTEEALFSNKVNVKLKFALQRLFKTIKG